jgi:GH24 family phage-related lysozyme (muramidase)
MNENKKDTSASQTRLMNKNPLLCQTKACPDQKETFQYKKKKKITEKKEEIKKALKRRHEKNLLFFIFNFSICRFQFLLYRFQFPL